MPERIVVPLDGSILAECTLPHTVALARAFGASVTCCQVVDRGDEPGRHAVDPLEWQLRRSEAEAYIQSVVQRLASLGLAVEGRVLEGQPAKAIVDLANQGSKDLIVLSSHGRSGLSEWGVSSVVLKVILRALAPVYLVRAYSEEEKDLAALSYRQILVPLDGSQRAEFALAPAAALARAHGAKMLLAHVVGCPEVPRRAPLTDQERDLVQQLVDLNKERAQRYLDHVRAQSPEGAEAVLLVHDSAAVALHRLVMERQVDLIVLSAHGFSGEARWPYGSVALNLIIYGSRALLVVQDIPPEAIQPTEAELASKEKKGH